MNETIKPSRPLTIRVYPDGKSLQFVQGTYRPGKLADEWKVQFKYADGRTWAPTDKYFLEFFKKYNDPQKVWAAIQSIGAQIDRSSLDLETFAPPVVSGNVDEAEHLDAYAACLIAEEQRIGTKLGKRIKLLAAYQVLHENMDILPAAKFSYGMKWRDIATLCEDRGF